MLLQQGVHDCDYFAAISLRLLGSDLFRLSYRHDLDGTIELAPCGVHHQMATVNATCPADEFGWLHPASSHSFVLDGRYWRTAHPRDWPWPLAREWRSQQTSDKYEALMKALLLARFTQHDNLRRRLQALRCSVTVADVPEGLMEEIVALV